MSNENVQDDLTVVNVEDDSDSTPDHNKLMRAFEMAPQSNASAAGGMSMTDLMEYLRTSSPPPASSAPSPDFLTYVKKMQEDLRAMGNPDTAEEKDWLQETKTAVDQLASDIDKGATTSADLESRVLALQEQISDRQAVKDSFGRMSHNL